MERKSHFTICIFLSLHDCSLLKVIKYSKLHKSGETGREWEMRGKAHLHLYLKWQMQMDQMIWQEKNVNSSLQLFADGEKKISVFSIGRGLLHFYKMPSYQTCNKPPWFHLEIPSDIFKRFRAAISLFRLRFCLSYAETEPVSVAGKKGFGLWDSQFKDTFYSKAESEKAQHTQSASSFIVIFEQFFFSVLPSSRLKDGVGLRTVIDCWFSTVFMIDSLENTTLQAFSNVQFCSNLLTPLDVDEFITTMVSV